MKDKNPNAIADAYKLFRETGYDGTMEKFVNLINTNPEALADAHKLFVNTGYDGDIDKFSTLVGVNPKKKSQSAVVEEGQRGTTQSTYPSGGGASLPGETAQETLNRLKGLAPSGTPISLQGAVDIKPPPPKKSDEAQYKTFLNTLPEGQRKEDPKYDMRYLWEQSGKPNNFEQVKDLFALDEKDGKYHAASVEPKTGRFLKRKDHPTVQKELDWYNSDDPEAVKFRSEYALDTSGEYYKYVKRVSLPDTWKVEDSMIDSRVQRIEAKPAKIEQKATAGMPSMRNPYEEYKKAAAERVQRTGAVNHEQIGIKAGLTLFDGWTVEDVGKQGDYVSSPEEKVRDEAMLRAGTDAIRRLAGNTAPDDYRSYKVKAQDVARAENNRLLALEQQRTRELSALAPQFTGSIGMDGKYKFVNQEYIDKLPEKTLQKDIAMIMQSFKAAFADSVSYADNFQKAYDVAQFMRGEGQWAELKKKYDAALIYSGQSPKAFWLNVGKDLDKIRKGGTFNEREAEYILGLPYRAKLQLITQEGVLNEDNKKLYNFQNDAVKTAQHIKLELDGMQARIEELKRQTKNGTMATPAQTQAGNELIQAYNEKVAEFNDVVNNIKSISPHEQAAIDRYTDASMKAMEAEEMLDMPYYTRFVQGQRDAATRRSHGEEMALRIVNESANLGSEIAKFPFALSLSVKALFDAGLNEEYTWNEEVMDILSPMEVQQYKDKKFLETDEAGNTKKNWEVLFYGAAQGLPMFAYFAVTMGMGATATVPKPMEFGLKAFGQTLKQDLARQMLWMFPATYASNYEQAVNQGLTGFYAFTYANQLSMAESIAELMLPQYKLFAPASKKAMTAAALKAVVKGEKHALVRFATRLSNGMIASGLEGSEETAASIHRMLAQPLYAMLEPDFQKEENPTKSDMIEEFMAAAILTLPMGIIGGGGDVSKRFARYHLAQNPTEAQKHIRGMMPAKDAEKEIAIIKRMAKVMKEVNAIQGLDEAQKIDVTYHLSEIERLKNNMPENETLKKQYTEQIKGLEKQIKTIIEEQGYSERINKEISDELEKFRKEQVKQTIEFELQQAAKNLKQEEVVVEKPKEEEIKDANEKPVPEEVPMVEVPEVSEAVREQDTEEQAPAEEGGKEVEAVLSKFKKKEQPKEEAPAAEEVVVEETKNETTTPDALKDVESTEKALEKINETNEDDVDSIEDDTNVYINSIIGKRMVDIIESLGLPDNVKNIVRAHFSISKSGEYLSSMGADRIIKTNDIGRTKKYLKAIGAELLKQRLDETSTKYSIELDKLNEDINEYLQSLLDAEERGDDPVYKKGVSEAMNILFDIQAKYEAIEDSIPNNVSEAYHAAKKDGSNPELVKAVEDLLSPKESVVVEKPKEEAPDTTTKEEKKEAPKVVKEEAKPKNATPKERLIFQQGTRGATTVMVDEKIKNDYLATSQVRVNAKTGAKSQRVGKLQDAIRKLSRIYVSEGELDLRGKTSEEIIAFADSLNEDVEINKKIFGGNRATVTRSSGSFGKNPQDYTGIIVYKGSQGVEVVTETGERVRGKKFKILPKEEVVVEDSVAPVKEEAPDTTTTKKEVGELEKGLSLQNKKKQNEELTKLLPNSLSPEEKRGSIAGGTENAAATVITSQVHRASQKDKGKGALVFRKLVKEREEKADTILDESTEVAAQYGWKVEKSDKGYNLINRKGTHAATLKVDKKGKYSITYPDGSKILTGAGILKKSVEKVIAEHFYGKKEAPKKADTTNKKEEKGEAETQVIIDQKKELPLISTYNEDNGEIVLGQDIIDEIRLIENGAKDMDKDAFSNLWLSTTNKLWEEAGRKNKGRYKIFNQYFRSLIPDGELYSSPVLQEIINNTFKQRLLVDTPNIKIKALSGDVASKVDSQGKKILNEIVKFVTQIMPNKKLDIGIGNQLISVAGTDGFRMTIPNVDSPISDMFPYDAKLVIPAYQALEASGVDRRTLWAAHDFFHEMAHTEGVDIEREADKYAVEKVKEFAAWRKNNSSLESEVVAESPSKIEEAKAEIGAALEKIVSSKGWIKKATAEERDSFREGMKELIGALTKYFSLQGQALWDRVMNELTNANVDIVEDILQEFKDEVLKQKPVVEQPPPPKKEKEGAVETEDEKQSGFEKRSIQRRMDEAGQRLKEMVDENPSMYKVLHIKDAIERAKKLIQEGVVVAEDGIRSLADIHAKLLVSVFSRGRQYTEEGGVIQMARQMLMDMYGRKMADALNEGNIQEAERYSDYAAQMEQVFQSDATKSGQMGAMTIWRFMPGNAAVFHFTRQLSEMTMDALGVNAQEVKNFVEEFESETPAIVKSLIEENKDLKAVIEGLQSKLNKRNQKPPKRTPKEGAKELADKVRAIDPSKWGLTLVDVTGMTGVFKMAITTVAKTIELTGNILHAINSGVRVIKNTEWYKGLTKAQQNKVVEKFKEEVRKETGFEFEETKTYEKLKGEKKEPKERKQTPEQWLEKAIKDVVQSHFDKSNTDRGDIVTSLMEDVGLTRREAESIADVVKAHLMEKVQKMFAGKFKDKSKSPVEQKNTIKKFVDLIMLGVLTTEGYAEAFLKKYGLRTTLTAEEKVKLQSLVEMTKALEGKGEFHRVAMEQLLRYMEQITPSETGLNRYTKLGIGFVYARMLMGPTTHYINIVSANANLALKPLFDLVDIRQWAMAAIAFAKDGRQGFDLVNPLRRLIYAYSAYTKVARRSRHKIAELVAAGDITQIQKYLDNYRPVAENIPILESHKYGKNKPMQPVYVNIAGVQIDINPFNLFAKIDKFAGRTLLAEDIAIRGMAYHAEVTLAVREALIRNKNLSGKELRQVVNNMMNEYHTDPQQKKAIDEQLMIEVEAAEKVGVYLTDRQKKIRREELINSRLDLSIEEQADMMDVARTDIFMGDSGGFFGQLARGIGYIARQNLVTQMVILPWVPFTKVLGQIGDFMLDTMYGGIRSAGWSPTGVIARGRAAIKQRGFSDGMRVFLNTSPIDTGFRSAQRGKRGSKMYEAQMARQMAGLTLLGGIAALFMKGAGDDDDNEYNGMFELTGGLYYTDREQRQHHPVGAFMIQIGGKDGRKFKYSSIPLIAAPLAIIGNYNDGIRAGDSADDLQARLALFSMSWLKSIKLVKESSLAMGIQNFIAIVDRAFGENKERKEIVTAKGIKKKRKGLEAFKQVGQPYAEMVGAAVSPLRNNMIQQMAKFYDPRSRMKRTPKQVLAYALGYQVLTNPVNTDMFGQEVKAFPGTMNIAYPKDDNWYWDMMFKYNIGITDVKAYTRSIYINRELNQKEYRLPENEEWQDIKKVANRMFAERFKRYFEENDEATLAVWNKETEINIQTGQEITKIQKDISKIWDACKMDAKDYINYFESPATFKPLLNEGLLPTPVKSGTYKKNDVKQDMTVKEIIAVNDEAVKYMAKKLKDYYKTNEYKKSTLEDRKIKVDNLWRDAKIEAKKIVTEEEGELSEDD